MSLTLNWVHQGTLFLGPATFTLEGRRTAGGDSGRIYQSHWQPE